MDRPKSIFWSIAKFAFILAAGSAAIFFQPANSVASPVHPKSPTWRVLSFWSSTCPCVKACERYSLVPLARKYRGQVSFVAVASDGYDLAMPRAELDGLIAEHHLPYPVVLDTTHRLALKYRALVTPQTVVLDPAGKVVFDGMLGKAITEHPPKEAGCAVAW